MIIYGLNDSLYISDKDSEKVDEMVTLQMSERPQQMNVAVTDGQSL